MLLVLNEFYRFSICLFYKDESNLSDMGSKMSEHDTKKVQKCQKIVSDKLTLKEGNIVPLLVPNDDIGWVKR